MLTPLLSVQTQHVTGPGPNRPVAFRFKGDSPAKAETAPAAAKFGGIKQKVKKWAIQLKTAIGNAFFSKEMMSTQEKSVVQLMTQFQSNLEKSEVRFTLPEVHKGKHFSVDLTIREKPYRLKFQNGIAYMLEQTEGPVFFARTQGGKVLLYRNRDSSFEIQSSNRYAIRQARILFQKYQNAFQAALQEAGRQTQPTPPTTTPPVAEK